MDKLPYDALAEQMLAIPAALILEYRQLGINERELTILLQIIAFKQTEANDYPSVEVLAAQSGLSEEMVLEIISSLMDKRILGEEVVLQGKANSMATVFVLTGLLKQLHKLKRKKQGRQLENSPELVRVEQYLGRLLTSNEIDNINLWLHKYDYSFELVCAALELTPDKKHFVSYVSTVLKDWKKQGISTTLEANDYAQNKRGQQGKNVVKQTHQHKIKEDKYKDIYLT